MSGTFVAILLLMLVWGMVRALSGNDRLEKTRVADMTRKYSNPEVRDAILKKQVWQRMSREQLIDSWGNPSGITQQVLKTKIKETYKYGSNRYSSSVYLENGVVTGWRQPK